MIWQAIHHLHWLWFLPVLVLLYTYAGIQRRRQLNRFADSEMLQRLTASLSPSRRRWKQCMILAGLSFIILGLARPAWNPVRQQVTRRGRDVVFVLDISRSMLADDLKPNRLERAKLAISDCLDILEGDRVGLVVFAGSALVRCPLTYDYGFFRMMLSDIEPRSVGRGGTKIGDALRMAQKNVLDKQDTKYKDILLITDGEDQDSFAVDAAKAMGKSSVRLLAVGLGDDNQGTPIMVTGEDGRKEFIKDGNGQMVRSRLDSATLREMVAATPGGRYLPVRTGNVDLGSIYRELIATAEKQEQTSETLERYEEKYQLFLAAGLLLLLLEPLISIRKRRQP